MKISLSNPMIELPDNSDSADFELLIPENNKKFAKFHLKKGKPLKVLDLPMFLVNVGWQEKSLTYIVDSETKYWCLYQVNTVGGLTILTQKAVWNDSHFERGFARRMVLDYFLQKFDVVQTSEIQRPRGAYMWETLVRECLDTDKASVYAFLNGSIIQIESNDRFKSLKSKIWGKLPEYKKAKLFLSKSVLI